MSVIELPRRGVQRPAPPRAAHRRPRASARRTPLAGRSAGTKAAWIIGGAVALVMAANGYAAERQVELHNLQTSLLSEQSAYAAQVASLTGLATPARVAGEAGRLHLVEPSSITALSTVPLDRPLPLVRLRGSYSVVPRVFR